MFKMIVAGNLGRDAEIKEINGQLCLSFSIAINQNYKNDQGQTIERATWINCNQWKEKGGRFGIAPYLKKGSKIIVEGTPSINTYRDQQNSFRAGFNLRIQEIHLVSSTAEKSNDSNNVTTSEVTALNNAAGGDEAPKDDLPF